MTQLNLIGHIGLVKIGLLIHDSAPYIFRKIKIDGLEISFSRWNLEAPNV